MTPIEFSNEFDTQIGAYLQSRAYGQTYSALEFDEYEKSVFLTKAQEAYVIGLYSGKNINGDSFEKTEEVRRDLANIVKTYITTDKQTYDVKDTSTSGGVSSDSYFFLLPNDLWFITYEAVDFDDEAISCASMTKGVAVYPVTQDEYHRIKKNPFRGANQRRVLRLDLGLGSDTEGTEHNLVELVSKYNISSYQVRYLSRPKPIILVDLPEDLSINGYNEIMGCELSSVTHRDILDRAILLAIASKSQGAPKEEQ